MAHRISSSLLALLLMGCPASDPDEGVAPSSVDKSAAEGKVEEAETATRGVDAGSKAPVREAEAPLFDPGNPPPGYRFCRARKCHTEDGRVLTYKEVMAEMGASRMVGGLDTTQFNPAPKDVARAPADAERSESGLAWRVLVPSAKSSRPGLSSRVLVHFEGWTSEGRAFDSSYARGRPLAFPLERVIPGWQEALMSMGVGEKRRLWVPEALAYKGLKGGPKGPLTFDLELIRLLSD